MGLQAERGLFPEALGLVERSWPQQTLPFLCLYLRLKISIHNQKATLDQIIADRESAERALLKDPGRARGRSLGSLSGVCRGRGGTKWEEWVLLLVMQCVYGIKVPG